jgi:dTMP kinase
MMFVKHLASINKHNHIVLTREPYQDTNIRKILREDTNPKSQAEKLADLFIEDRKKHVEELIIPNKNKGLHVISDRYKLSTIAYQSAQGLSIENLIEKQKGLPIPDICFLIDLPASAAAKRMQLDIDRREHKFEANLDFLESVRQQYLKAKLLLPEENIHLIKADRPIGEIFSEIKDIFDKFIADENK